MVIQSITLLYILKCFNCFINTIIIPSKLFMDKNTEFTNLNVRDLINRIQNGDIIKDQQKLTDVNNQSLKTLNIISSNSKCITPSKCTYSFKSTLTNIINNVPAYQITYNTEYPPLLLPSKFYKHELKIRLLGICTNTKIKQKLADFENNQYTCIKCNALLFNNQHLTKEINNWEDNSDTDNESISDIIPINVENDKKSAIINFFFKFFDY